MRNIIPTVQEIQIEKGDDFTVVTSLEEMIKANVESIDRLKVEARKLREMIEDGFANDVVYKEHDNAVKAATKIRTATKAQIMKNPAIAELVNKLKTIKSEQKEKQFALSDYLLEFKRLTTATQLELFDGQVLDIVETAKVVRRSK